MKKPQILVAILVVLLGALAWWSPELGLRGTKPAAADGADDAVKEKSPAEGLVSDDSLGSDQDAVSTKTDMFWQRGSMVRPHDLLKPFRKPKGVDIARLPKGQMTRFWNDVDRVRRLRDGAKKGQVRFDSSGREIVDDKAWREAAQKLQQSNFKLEGFVAYVFRDSTSFVQRRNVAYAMFYFQDAQQVFHLIEHLAAEPDERIRREATPRALKFLARWLPESKPLNPAAPKGFMIPRLTFNAYGFFELAKRDEAHLSGEGLKFLTEVLRIRPDLGKVWLERLRPDMPRLLTSPAEFVRRRAATLVHTVLRARPKGQGNLLGYPSHAAGAEEQRKWWRKVNDTLYPSIRHISSGRTELHAGQDRLQLVRVGTELLAKKDAIGGAREGTLTTGQFYRGFIVQRLPEPLHKLGLPKGAVITNVNNVPVFDSTLALKHLRIVAGKYQDALKKHERQLKEFTRTKKPGQQPPPSPKLSVQVLYVYKGKRYLRDFVWL